MPDDASKGATPPFPDDDAAISFARALVSDSIDRDASSENSAAVNVALDRLLYSTASRAVGFWRVTDVFLIQLGFRAVDDMPIDVREGFREATRRLPLARTDLGIVKAAVSKQPTPAVLQKEKSTNAGGLSGSASWLERFACRQSLAVPIDRKGQILGVIALSTPELFSEESLTWRALVELANLISQKT